MEGVVLAAVDAAAYWGASQKAFLVFHVALPLALHLQLDVAEEVEVQ